MGNLINSVSIIILGISNILLGTQLLKEREINQSHWKVTEHELNLIWDRVDEVEGKAITIE